MARNLRKLRQAPSVDRILDLLDLGQTAIERSVVVPPDRSKIAQLPRSERLGAAPGRDSMGRVQLMIFGLARRPLALSLQRCRAIVRSLEVLEKFANGRNWRPGVSPDESTRLRKIDGTLVIEVGGAPGRPLRLSVGEVAQLLTLRHEIVEFVATYSDAERSIL